MSTPVPEGFSPIAHSAAFGRLVGPFYDRAEGEGFVRAFRVDERHVNSLGIAHGGMLATFADVLLGTAAFRALGRPTVTVRMVCDFLGPARRGDWVEGRAQVVRATRSLVFLRGDLTVGRHAVLAADGVFRILPRPRAGAG
jgi:uncharacterized protein (TIGR00369 family)